MSANNMNSIVEKIAKHIPVENFDVEYSEGNQKGEGYMGEMGFVTIIDKDDGKKYDVAIKKAFTDKTIRDDMPIREVFMNEVLFYKEVSPTLKRVQVENNLPKFDNTPKCYYTSTEAENEYLAMENLKSLNFELFPKEDIVPYDHYVFIFKIYANLHATSFIFYKTQREEFKKLTSKFNELSELFFNNLTFSKVWNDMIKNTCEKLIPGKDDEAIEAYQKKYSEKPLETFMNSWTYKGKHPVINHGDCWSNNMMFKYNEQRDLTDLKMIDWQLLKVGSPAHDLAYCLYSGASKETFDKLEDLLQIYYKTFTDILKKANLDPEEVYPYSVLKKEWKEYANFGWIMSLVVVRIKMTKAAEKLDMMDLSNSDDKEGTAKKIFEGNPCEEYDGRMRELLLHVHAIGAL